MSWLSKIFGGGKASGGEAVSGQPERLMIFPDEYHLPHVGRTSDGRHVFLTQPFVPAIGEQSGGEYIALYIFEADGSLVDHSIISLGSRADLDRDHAKRLYEELLSSISPLTLQGIFVQPFSVEHDGVEFGLIPRAPEEEDEDWSVEVQPGNYIAFIPPWDDGGYDT